MESRKVELYICVMTKTIKIPDNVHKELKIFVAQNPENITDFAGIAIMKELKERGHKFTQPVKKMNHPKSKQ